jgi:hypothetical protein
LEERNVTYNFTGTTSAPVEPPCGLFGLSVFCPLQFRGIIGRLIRRLFG